MIRKFALAAAAIAALGTVSLAVSATPADAKGKGKGGFHHHKFHGGHFWRGFHFYAPIYGYAEPCLRRVWVVNRYGEEVLRTVNVCY